MSAKQLLFGGPAHGRLVRGMNVLADAVRVTLGPKARTVIAQAEEREARETAEEMA